MQKGPTLNLVLIPLNLALIPLTLALIPLTFTVTLTLGNSFRVLLKGVRETDLPEEWGHWPGGLRMMNVYGHQRFGTGSIPNQEVKKIIYRCHLK